MFPAGQSRSFFHHKPLLPTPVIAQPAAPDCSIGEIFIAPDDTTEVIADLEVLNDRIIYKDWILLNGKGLRFR